MSTMVDTWKSGSGRITRPFVDPMAVNVLPAGTTVDSGRYQIHSVLGRGAFGVTYAAVDTRLGRPVAIKALLAPPSDRDRFVREAANLAQFAHVGIVRIYELVEEHGAAYVVMERL